jgi:murein DD-endopeptidase MepM/ murein hydrolase activator NlpD
LIVPWRRKIAGARHLTTLTPSVEAKYDRNNIMSRTTFARAAVVIVMVAMLGLSALPVPVVASETTESEETVETTEPEPVEPIEPAPPAEPVEPVTVEPVEPIEPLEPVEPVEPVAPPGPPAPPGATFIPVIRIDVVRDLVFPIVGTTRYWSGFGDCRDRCTREHHGVDIMTYGWKGLPVVAAHAGTVTKITDDEGNAGCSIRIRSRDRWETRYLHLNNDTPGTDSAGYNCVAPGIKVGTRVDAGQLIGWVGDSGNSEKTQPHLHFELRNRSGYPIDPYRSLRKADKVTYEWLSPDTAAASIVLSQANQTDGASYVFVVTREDFPKIVASEVLASILQAPLIVIDQMNPQPALDEISRLKPSRILVLTDDKPEWLMERMDDKAMMVETAAVPGLPVAPINELGVELDIPEVVPDIPDRFATIISGRVDRIRRSHQDEYSAFVERHRSVVLVDTRWANRNLGQRSKNSPGRNADRDLLWWNTGDGWIPTMTLHQIPEPGFAYLTERQATPWNLTFLGSFAEAPPMPVWKG